MSRIGCLPRSIRDSEAAVRADRLPEFRERDVGRATGQPDDRPGITAGKDSGNNRNGTRSNLRRNLRRSTS